MILAFLQIFLRECLYDGPGLGRHAPEEPGSLDRVHRRNPCNPGREAYQHRYHLPFLSLHRSGAGWSVSSISSPFSSVLS